MISAGLEGRLPYMTYPEPWRGPPKQPPEFLRPAPKPVPPTTSRYNGVTASPNGIRLPPAQRPISKYPSPPSISAPVNLTQHKDEIVEELPYYRLYTTPPQISHFPQFTTIYQNHYPPMIRSTFPTTSLQPLETYSPTTPTAITSSTFLSPPSTFSPPSPVKTGPSVLRDKRITSQTVQPTSQVQSSHQSVPFKIPSGKEGSLKHRILTRPDDGTRSLAPLDLQKSTETPRRRLNATMSPPRSPRKPINNNISTFTKGCLIQLISGELRKIEDMTTEDFITSADNSPELQLARSTVLRIEEHSANGTATITLTYDHKRTQVDFECALEHPFFVIDRGWSSCNPERTQQFYHLNVHRLAVGDVIVSLTPRESFSASSLSRSATIVTTATSTAMTARQLPLDSMPKVHHETDQSTSSQMQPMNLHTASHPPHTKSPDNGLSIRKRSAPDQNCDEEEQHSMKRHRIE